MIGLRHVLVHGYYKIKPKQLWNIIEKDIPILMPQKKISNYLILRSLQKE
ncbi:HepT-like ribonuclease domain-containing protein [Segatella copri]